MEHVGSYFTRIKHLFLYFYKCVASLVRPPKVSTQGGHLGKDSRHPICCIQTLQNCVMESVQDATYVEHSVVEAACKQHICCCISDEDGAEGELQAKGVHPDGPKLLFDVYGCVVIIERYGA